MVIVADSSGKELRKLKYNSFDFEIGDDANSFEVKILITDWEPIPKNSLIYIPNTEYGGIYKRTEIDRWQGYVSIGGFTWRGMLQNAIISPPTGADYARDEGDVNAIIGARVRSAYKRIFVGGAPAGVNVSYRYDRYVTVLDGLTAMLKKVNRRIRLRYDQEQKRVIVDSAPIRDYSDSVEFSDDVQTNYYMLLDETGVNHLICLGDGQLKNRIRVDLYVDRKGNISESKTFSGVDEVTAVYDYAGADREQLIESGTEQLKSMQSVNQFSIDAEGENLEIGDIVGACDYVTGKSMKAPISGKIHKSKEGIETTEYTISDNVEVT